MIKQLVRYFDQMAVIIRKMQGQKILSDKDISSFLHDRENPVYFILTKKVPQLIKDNQIVRNLYLKDLNDALYSNVEEIIESDNAPLLILLLYYMDRAIVDCYKQQIGFEDDIEVVDALNSNGKDTQISVLKKAKCKWAPREYGRRIKGIMDNFYYIDHMEMDRMNVRHYILDPGLLVFDRKSELKLAISPVTQKETIEFSNPYERPNEKTGARQKLFRVENVIDEHWIQGQVLENICIAGENGADILVFPEMLGTQSMLHEVRKRIRQNKTADVPGLIVFPSIWEKTENDKENTNKSCLLLNGDEILFEQHKRCDYKYDTPEGPVYEDINRDREKNNVVHMLHVEGLGRICIIICYDYLDTYNRELIMKNLCPTLVCNPSFSTGSFNFEILGESYFKQGCNWIWCNTCSAANLTEKEKNFEIIGMITTLSKDCDQTKADSFKQIFEGKTKCQKSECKNCIYYAEIPLVMQ